MNGDSHKRRHPTDRTSTQILSKKKLQLEHQNLKLNCMVMI